MRSERNGMIVVQSNAENQVEIHLDPEGIDRLRRKLESLIAKPVNDHLHLTTPEWAGDDLDSTPMNEGATIVHKLDIYLWRP